MPSPPGKRGAFAHVVSPGDWQLYNFIAAPAAGHTRDPLAFDTRVTDEFIGKDEAFVKDWLVRQGLEKLVDDFKGLFSQF